MVQEQLPLILAPHPGANETSVAVTGITGISGTSKVDAFVMADDTSADHTANDHKYLEVFASLCCGNIVAGTGFTIYARSSHKLSGQWTVRYVWAD